MKFLAASMTDIGNRKKTNQDSILVRIANIKDYGQIAMLILCDGMGGYSKGELASATVTFKFAEWFERRVLESSLLIDPDVCEDEWISIIRDLNETLRNYGLDSGIKIGTTFSGMLLFQDKYMIVHVGDSRIYELKNAAVQLTKDHSFVAREVELGNMTEEEARMDSRRNILLQCIGRPEFVYPQVRWGSLDADTAFMLCTDGLYRTASNDILYELLEHDSWNSMGSMLSSCNKTIESAKTKLEKDNISIAVIKCMEEVDSLPEESKLIQDFMYIHTDEIIDIASDLDEHRNEGHDGKTVRC